MRAQYDCPSVSDCCGSSKARQGRICTNEESCENASRAGFQGVSRGSRLLKNQSKSLLIAHLFVLMGVHSDSPNLGHFGKPFAPLAATGEKKSRSKGEILVFEQQNLHCTHSLSDLHYQSYPLCIIGACGYDQALKHTKNFATNLFLYLIEC